MAQPIPPNPHASGEDPEEHIGDIIPDPWDDDAQTDWPNDPDKGVK